jgi:hypothetical protein
MRQYLRASIIDNRASIAAWRDRIRNPSLSVLLVLQLFLLFLAVPLAATGLPLAGAVDQWLLLTVLALVVMLSQRGGAIVIILLGLAAILASVTPSRDWPPMTASVLHRGGIMLTFSALTWVVAHAVYARGRVTFHRLQGAVVVYLSLATIFAAAFRRFGAKPDKNFVDPQAAIPSSRKTPCMASCKAW